MSARIVDFDTAAGTVHSNSTTEASVAGYTFKAGSLSPGKVYMFDCGLRATSTNATDTLTVAVRFGSSATVTSNTACATSGAIDAANDDICVVRGMLHCMSATRAVMTVYLADPDAEGTTSVEQYMEILTIDQVTDYNLDVTCDWSVAHSDNDVQSEAWAVIELV
jgi:hypothetical protein